MRQRKREGKVKRNRRGKARVKKKREANKGEKGGVTLSASSVKGSVGKGKEGSAMDSDNDNDFLDNVDSGNVSSGDDGDDDFAMEVDMPSSTERQLDTDDHQYKVLTTDEIVQYQREIIDEVNRVLKVSHTSQSNTSTHTCICMHPRVSVRVCA